MSTATLYDPTGEFYDQIPRGLAMLGDPQYLKLHPEHKGFFRAAHLGCHALADLIAAGKARLSPGGFIELGEEHTDRFFQEESPWLKGKCRSFVQKSWHALEDILGWIDRHRQHGRRAIRILWRLRGRGGIAGSLAPASSPSAPPQTPPEGSKQQTTTGSRSSSSPENAQEKTPEPDDPAIAELVGRACRLVPEVTPGQVRTAIGEFTAEWVALALDRVEKRNRTPGKKPVTSWGFVLRILLNRRREGWEPPAPKPSAALPAAVKAPAAPEGPPRKLLPAELAELVAQCSQGPQALRKLVVLQLRSALRDGLVPAELIPTIPGELLAGSGVPAVGSG
jgi:hypothetical protein